MKKHLFLFQAFFIACVMLLAGGTVRAEMVEKTITLDFEGSGTFPYDARWSASNFESNSSYNHAADEGVCAATNKIECWLTYEEKIPNIKSVSAYVSKSSKNTSSGPILIQYSADNAEWETLASIDFTNGSAVSGKGVWAELKAENVGKTGYIRIGRATGTTAQRLVDDIVITYEEDPATAVTETTTTFGAEVDEKTFEVKVGEEAAFEAPKATLSPAEAGTLTYSSSNPSAIDVDAQTGDLTFHATGTATITASFAATDAYGSSSNYYVVKYYNPNAITFSVENGSFVNAGSYSDAETTLNFPASDGNTYAFACTNVRKGNGNVLQLKSGSGKAVSPEFSSTCAYLG